MTGDSVIESDRLKPQVVKFGVGLAISTKPCRVNERLGACQVQDPDLLGSETSLEGGPRVGT